MSPILQLPGQALLYGLVNPMVVVPALAIGWLGRRTWMPAAGAVVIAVVQTLLSLGQPLPAGAQRLWWAEPFGLLAPSLLAYASFFLHQWLRARAATAPESRLPRLVRTGLGGAIGAIAGAGIFFLAGLAIDGLAGLQDREGGDAYVLVFIVAPIGLIIGLCLGARWGWRRSACDARATI